MTDRELERIMLAPGASDRARKAASDEWHERRDREARASAVAAHLSGMRENGFPVSDAAW